MARSARIKLTSANIRNLEQVCQEIRDMTEKTGIKVKGPIPLPTKRLKVVTRKAPSGQGSHTYDHWQMRIHRRLFDMGADDRAMKQLIRVKVPEDVYMEVSLS